MTEAKRGFEFVERVADDVRKVNNFPFGPLEREEDYVLRDGLQLPKRSTKGSAGYDFVSNQYTTIPSVWKQAFKFFLKLTASEEKEELFKPALVRTGVKAFMQEDEVLELYNRSSNPMKRMLVMSNGVGVIDSDYYGNPDNDGEIMFQFLNFGFKDKLIAPGDKIGQGIFKKFLKADDEEKVTNERVGGHGSTGN